MVKFSLIVILISLLTPFFIGIALAAESSDLQTMENARKLYAAGKLEDAKKKYSEIKPSSDFWLDSIEERAWANTRAGNYEKALADLQSITSDFWSSQVGPETLMLSTFVSLKICAYKDVLKKIKLFKERMLPRVDALEKIAKGDIPEEFWTLADGVKKGNVSLVSLAKSAESYPRYFYRDQTLADFISARKNMSIRSRMKFLAKQDLEEIETNLKKMKIMEVEMIQKILLSDKEVQKSKQKLQFADVDSRQAMTFPVKDDEIWIDEIGHFQVRSDLCPFKKGSSL